MAAHSGDGVVERGVVDDDDFGSGGQGGVEARAYFTLGVVGDDDNADAHVSNPAAGEQKVHTPVPIGTGPALYFGYLALALFQDLGKPAGRPAAANIGCPTAGQFAFQKSPTRAVAKSYQPPESLTYQDGPPIAAKKIAGIVLGYEKDLIARDQSNHFRVPGA